LESKRDGGEKRGKKGKREMMGRFDRRKGTHYEDEHGTGSSPAKRQQGEGTGYNTVKKEMNGAT